ncbi:unnamed protein product, partial [Oppiella nova]
MLNHLCWLALIWLHIMYTFITHRMCDSRISFSDLFLEFYRTLTNQTATKLNVFSNFNIAYNKNILYILLFLWIICVNFISKAFSSVLRNSYFKFKPTLMADSLEDLMDNMDIMIAGRGVV